MAVRIACKEMELSGIGTMKDEGSMTMLGDKRKSPHIWYILNQEVVKYGPLEVGPSHTYLFLKAQG